MKWVTWQNVGVDRMACAWLIMRWLDPDAEFIFVPAGAKSLPDDAQAFDIPGARFGHHRGHCSFYTMLKEYKFKDPILQQIARIVDEADVMQEVSIEPASPGLDLICRGLRKVSKDDDEAVRYGRIVYNALYTELSQSSSIQSI